MSIKKVISDLVEKYEQDRENYINLKYNETQLRNDFLDPFFTALGWDINNSQGKTTNEREVILEESLKANISENSKKPDYTFRLFSERKFFLEAKKPNVKIESNSDSAKQVRRYGFTAKLKISVLSNFEYLSIYDCSEEVKESDTTNTAIIKRYYYKDYVKNFEEIYSYLSKESVYSGKFDIIWSDIESRLNHFSVDDLFLKQINEWRLSLGSEIYKHQPGINELELNDLVQSYINSIIFLRVCEDRNLEEYKELLSFASKKDFQALINKFEKADKKYNSGLFNQKLANKIISDNSSIFWKIINKLYYPESPYSFSVFSSDILGNIYEIFLAEKLKIENNNVFLIKKPENIDRDIVTTPTNIIQSILRDTVISYCEGKSDDNIFNSKIADISCGSGAFLLETFQLLNDFFIDYYLQSDKDKLIQIGINSYKLKFEVKKKILVNCIYGIDKDYNAVQACKFGLLLKLLEEEDNNTIPNLKPILPSLDNNIIFGNSLIESDYIKNTEDITDINPLNLGTEKFDIIIGNPPYLKSEDMKNITPKELVLYEKYYKSAYKQFDKYFLFIERALKLLKTNGYFGFIVPSKFIKVGSGKELRNILKESKNLTKLVSFGANQIFKDKTTYTCLLFLNKSSNEVFKYTEINNFNDWKIRNIKDDIYDTIEIDSLDTDNWILVPGNLKEVFHKINSKSIKLEELLGDGNIFNGIQTSANKVYIHKPIKEDENYYYFIKDKNTWKIEKDLTRPYFQTSNGDDNLNTYRKFQPNSFVIYPYKKIDDNIELVGLSELEKDYPFAYNYLNTYKTELNNDKRDIKPTPRTENEWYRYGRHQSLDKCEIDKKIIVGVLSIGNKYAIDEYKTLISSGGTAGYCIISLPDNFSYSIYYIQALLNSKYLEWYSSLIGEIFRGGYIARGTKVLKQLPIIKIDFSIQEQKEIHDSISNLQKELIDLNEKIEQSIDRNKLPLQRIFEQKKFQLDSNLQELFNLGDDDNLIPIISKIYEIN
nr:Eco57I restriction-modification methylase domain-containing protein [Candidatus Gracilibacteria bacterium]